MKTIFLLCILFVSMGLAAQDSVPPTTIDTLRAPVQAPRIRVRQPLRPVVDTTVVQDSLPSIRPAALHKVDSAQLADSTLYAHHPFFRFTSPVRYPYTVHQWEGKEVVFYAVIGLLLLFALIRNGFNRYVQDLVKIYFRTTMKQKQIRDQLVESPVPSLFLNLFFIISGGFFLALLLHYFKLGLQFDLWELFGYCMAGLLAIYLIKFLTLKMFGWVFQVSEATNSYVFIIFSTNKIIGMSLLPFIVVLAFSKGVISDIAMNMALLVIIGLLCYRFFLSWATIHRQIRINMFHFFLYLVAFELAPVLLINKLLFRLLGETS